MARYPHLLEENEALKRENKLLRETAENSEVLCEKVESLGYDLARALSEAAEGDKVTFHMKLCYWFKFQ
jgi:N-glycosylase/DNA lyase